jgi:hypothetical protein
MTLSEKGDFEVEVLDDLILDEEDFHLQVLILEILEICEISLEAFLVDELEAQNNPKDLECEMI